MLLPKARDPQGSVLRAWRRGAMLALLALCALLAQNVALAGHIHPQGAGVAGVVAAHGPLAHTGGTSIGPSISKATTSDDEDCPLCEARQLAGFSLLPADIVLDAPQPCGAGQFALCASAGLHRATSHRWRSRAPPALA